MFGAIKDGDTWRIRLNWRMECTYWRERRSKVHQSTKNKLAGVRWKNGGYKNGVWKGRLCGRRKRGWWHCLRLCYDGYRGVEEDANDRGEWRRIVAVAKGCRTSEKKKSALLLKLQKTHFASISCILLQYICV